MSMIWETARRGSIVLAGTFLALNLTGSSATALANPNGTTGLAAGASISIPVAEPSETVRKCVNGLQYASIKRTCDPVDLVNE